MVGYRGRDAQETFLRSILWGRTRLQRSQVEPELRKLFNGTYQMMMGRDFSEEPELFNHPLTVKGIFIYKHASHWLSDLFRDISFDVILYNQVDMQNVLVPSDFIKVRMRDLQEFPYTAAIRVRIEPS